jgi:adenylate cyclase
MAETRKIAAILVADVVGYSRLAGADEEGTLARLRALRGDLIDPAVAAHHGRIVKRTGDGSLIEFRSVVEAVRCAIEVQNGMIERNSGLPPEKRIEFRVGIHLGDVVEEADGDLMGDGVNIAARLEGICEPGAICLSEDAYRQVKARLDLAVTDLGPKELKNIAESIRVYSLEVGAPARAKHTPPAPAPERSAPPRLSIVVLPFKNLSNDASQDYFADGVTENLTTDLSRIRNSFVIARNTAFTFKGKAVDSKQISKELGVRYVLGGSVQRDQNRVRVNAQLIDGETGAHLWADRFQEDVADLFKLQDDVVGRLANSLGYELIKAEAGKSVRSRNPDAIDLDMRGRAILLTRVQQGANEKDINHAAQTLFEQALAIDPNNADALADSAFTYFLEYFYKWGTAATDYEAKVLGQADAAVALAPDNVGAYYAKSFYLNGTGRPGRGLRAADEGLAINPNYAPLYNARGWAKISLGQFDEAKSDILHAMRLSPRDPTMGLWRTNLADAELGLGHFDAAIDHLHKAIDAGYRASYSYRELAAACALAGKTDDAKTALAEARRLTPTLTVKWVAKTNPLPVVLEGLRKAGLPDE